MLPHRSARVLRATTAALAPNPAPQPLPLTPRPTEGSPPPREGSLDPFAAERSTLPPEAISDELRPTVEALGLVENCRELASQGWTIVRDAASPEFIARLRETTLRLGADDPFMGSVFSAMAKGDVYAEAVLNPKVSAMAEFSVGRGNLISSVIGR